MDEILDGVWHWTTFHERIGHPVHSHFLETEGVVIDPRVPEEGLEWFEGRTRPGDALLTNRHHHRHAELFGERFGTTVWCHRNGLHEFTGGESVEPFEFAQELPGGIVAMEVGALCPEETALFHEVKRLLALGDSVVRWGEDLGFVPDEFMGDDPAAVKEGLAASLGRLLELDFRHLLLAHGEPIVDDGKERLAAFLAA